MKIPDNSCFLFSFIQSGYFSHIFYNSKFLQFVLFIKARVFEEKNLMIELINVLWVLKIIQ